MNTRMIAVTQEERERILQEAGSIIRNGGLVAFPTETVYGLGGDALNPHSSRKIYEAKGRPSDNPLIIHISRMEDLYAVAEHVSEEARMLAERFWPGPLTLVLPKADIVPPETTGGLDTVAVRMPSNELARDFIRYSGGFVAAPSANLSGRPSPTLARYVAEDMDGRIDMILDGGEGDIGLESTIVDVTASPPQILRPGFITEAMLEQVLGRVETDRALLSPGMEQAPRAPGMKYRHYAPKGDLVIVEGEQDAVAAYINARIREDMAGGERTGVICTDATRELYGGNAVKSVGSREREEEIGRRLYRILRELDNEGVTKIYSEAFSGEGLGEAIMNRLLKAAGYKIVKTDREEKG